MQPQIPVIQARGAGEITLQTQPTIRPELSAAYSPLNHVIVLGNGIWRTPMHWQKGGESDNFSILQYELGVGTYWALGPHWVAQATLGRGSSQTRRDVNDGLYSFNSFYEARYTTGFGQVGLYRQTKNKIWGVGYRLTRVAFQELSATDSGTGTQMQYTLPLDGQWRHEPFGFVRVPFGLQHHWALHLSLTYSWCRPGRPGYPNNLNEVDFRAHYNRGNALLVGGGIAYSFTR